MEKIHFSQFKKNLLSNSVLVSLRYVVVACIGLLVSVAFARLAPKEVFGQYQFILALFSFFTVFSLPGLNLAALKAVSQGESGVVSQAVRLSFIWSFLAIPLLIGYGIYTLYNNESSLVGWACIVFGLLFPFLNAPNTWYVYYEGRLRFFPVFTRVIGTSTLTALLLFLGLWNQVSVIFLVGIWFFVSLVSAWYFYWEVVKEERMNTAERGKLDVTYGFRVTLQKFVVSLTENIPILAISFFLGFEAVANFQVASVFVGAVSGLLGALTSMALPVFFSNLSNQHLKIFWYSALSGVLASLGYALLVEMLFLFVYGNQYQESLELARLFSLIPFLVSLRMYFVNVFTARGKNAQVILGYLLANAVAMILFWLSVRNGFSFAVSATIYLYVLNLQLILSFASPYFFKASEKTVSI